MAKKDIDRIELVWPGKYDEEGRLVQVERVNLPFQVIETIGESRATREVAKKEREDIPLLYDLYHKKEGDTFEEGWKNRLVWGENKYVMSSLLEQFTGKIDLVYIDPPFATGADFSFVTEIGDSGQSVTKAQSIIEEKAYRDTWGKGLGTYLTMMLERLSIMHELLSETGSIYVHLDWHVGHFIKPVLDDLFGRDNFQNEIVWAYKTQGATKRRYSRKHDTIFFYTKTGSWVFNYQTERSYMQHKYGFDKEDFKIDEEGRQYRDTIARDVWEISAIQSATRENLGFRTQKPKKLLERIILSSSNPGGIIADFFCGSGTALAVAEKLGRRWIGCDLSRWAIHTSRKRLQEIEDCRPFEVLNLGKYERKYWQGVTFGREKKESQELAIFEYLEFVLRLYGAAPLSGMKDLHGKKGNAVVHIGAVEAPVTIDEINACLDECKAIKQKELHVLGWEWEMGLYEIITEAARGRGIKLLLLQIPREVMEQQAVDRGDIHFFELAYLEARIKTLKGRKVAIRLKDFVIPNTELIPQEVRDKVNKWSDFIDYWAVDWDFRNDTFMQGWVDYRTRKKRSLSLNSDLHAYEKPGKYTVMVKVIDIFGNDTSQLFETEVK